MSDGPQWSNTTHTRQDQQTDESSPSPFHHSSSDSFCVVSCCCSKTLTDSLLLFRITHICNFILINNYNNSHVSQQAIILIPVYTAPQASLPHLDLLSRAQRIELHKVQHTDTHLHSKGWFQKWGIFEVISDLREDHNHQGCLEERPHCPNLYTLWGSLQPSPLRTSFSRRTRQMNFRVS